MARRVFRGFSRFVLVTILIGAIACGGRLPTPTPVPTARPLPTATATLTPLPPTATPRPLPAPDMVLGVSGEVLAELLVEDFDRIRQLARDPSEKLNLMVGKSRVLTLSIPRERRRGIGRPLKLTLEAVDAPSETRYLDWKGSSLVLTNEQGEIEKEAPFLEQISTTNVDPETLLKFGAATAIVALAVWLGAKIAALVLAAVAFVALVVLFVGLLAGGVGAALALAGINEEDIKNFLEKSKEKVREILEFLMEVLEKEKRRPTSLRA